MAEVLIRLTARLKGPSFVTGTNRIYRLHKTKEIVSILRLETGSTLLLFIDLQNRFIEWLQNRFIEWLQNRFIEWLQNRFIEWLQNRFIEWLQNRFIEWLQNRFIEWLQNRFIEWLQNRFIEWRARWILRLETDSTL